MKFLPSFLTVRSFFTRNAAWLIIFACLFSAGCFSQRDHSSWSDPDLSAGQYAVLPVLPEQISITLDAPEITAAYELSSAYSNLKNKEQAARVINEVLDTIAAGETNRLQGPSKVDSILKLTPDCKYIEVYLRDAGPLNEQWKREGLNVISRNLGDPIFLHVSPTLKFDPNLSIISQSEFGIDAQWDGRIIIEVEMLNFKTAQILTTGSGEGSFHGNTGALILGGYGGAIAIPYAYGKAFDDAVDQAVRKALVELFGNLQDKGGAL